MPPFAVQLKAFKLIHVKTFLRTDQYDRGRFADLPDIAKVRSTRIELLWTHVPTCTRCSGNVSPRVHFPSLASSFDRGVLRHRAQASSRAPLIQGLMAHHSSGGNSLDRFSRTNLFNVPSLTRSPGAGWGEILVGEFHTHGSSIIWQIPRVRQRQDRLLPPSAKRLKNRSIVIAKPHSHYIMRLLNLGCVLHLKSGLMNSKKTAHGFLY